ncbi:hypothetical protein PUNSTDRAFT_44611 [Punctularia strigosozonata HHB-11173 SS5]|uniref:uncharacterized protein n=1 Tax=Punctularia strigosozonata (strain HHB-11173) TaxID=741275 RepID=UPI0004416CF5|nr:uncharacterized protein PUNSTDRAFT_44611 [Punctularia strigosozonata HHB-11173 SS5]EIN09207.1 hypothetical protein PUNSTDRAFT_44611 [Punctularia strigosozonata HHB-11173 SS5]
MSDTIFDGYYDVPAAVTKLDSYIESASSGEAKFMQLACLRNQSGMDYSATVQNIGVPKRFRLCKSSLDNPNVCEELVFRAQGIVVECSLLPLGREIAGNKFNLRQTVVLSGFNSQLFEEFLDSCAIAYNMFKRHLPPTSLFPLAQETINLNNHTYSAIRFTNPVFTKPNTEGISSNTLSLEIPDELDPSRALRKSQGNALYLDDNAIHIYRVEKPFGTLRRTTAGTVNIGDMVELEMSFWAMKTRNKRFRMEIGPRSIAVLDQTYQEVSSKSS